MKLLWKMRFILRDYWKHYLLAFISLQAVAVLNQLPPWLIGRVVDEITIDGLTSQELLLYIASIIVIAIAIYGLRYVWRSLLYGASIDLVRSQRDRLFAHFHPDVSGFLPEAHHRRLDGSRHQRPECGGRKCRRGHYDPG